MRAALTPLRFVLLFILSACALSILSACAGGDAPVTSESASGDCFVGEPGGEPRSGNSGYLLGTGKIPEGSGPGAVNLSILCVVPGSAGDEVALLLPFLSDDRIETGEYTVVDPAGPEPGEIPIGERAFGYVERTPVTPTNYVARSGSIKILAHENNVLRGAYALYLTPEDPALQDELVLAGSFLAPPRRPR